MPCEAALITENPKQDSRPGLKNPHQYWDAVRNLYEIFPKVPSNTDCSLHGQHIRVNTQTYRVNPPKIKFIIWHVKIAKG
jgi:hypothetical protein